MSQNSPTKELRRADLSGLIEPLAEMIASADDPSQIRAWVIDEIREQVVGIDREANLYIQQRIQKRMSMKYSL